jgi:hypothetical protein
MTQEQPTLESLEAEPELPPEEVIRRLRAKVEQGMTLTREEVRQGLDAYRQGRISAASATGTKSKAKGPTRSAEELLSLLNTPTTEGDSQ